MENQVMIYYSEDADFEKDGEIPILWSWVWIKEGEIVAESTKPYDSEEELLDSVRGFFDEQLPTFQGHKPDLGTIRENVQATPTGYCWCGCGRTTSKGRFWYPGDDGAARKYLKDLGYKEKRIADRVLLAGFHPTTNPLKEEWKRKAK